MSFVRTRHQILRGFAYQFFRAPCEQLPNNAVTSAAGRCRPFASSAHAPDDESKSEKNKKRPLNAFPRISYSKRISKNWNETKQECQEFLKRIKEVPNGVVAQRVKEMLLRILSTPPHPEKGPLAEKLLQVANKDLDSSSNSATESGDTFELRAKLYQMTIEAWLVTGSISRNGRQDAWTNAEKLLWEMFSDNEGKFLCRSTKKNVDNLNGAFAALVFAFCKAEKHELSTKTQVRIEPFIRAMQQLWNDTRVNLVPSSVAMDAILYYYFKIQQPDKAYQILQQEILGALSNHKNKFLKPTLHGMNTVISAYAKQGNALKAREIVELMLAESARKGTNVPRPNTVSFNGLLNAIAKRGGIAAGAHAEEVLEWMENLSINPDTFSYTTAISAWNASQNLHATDKAEAILRRMIYLQQSGRNNVAPNEVTFSSVIHAWTISGRADAAERAVAVMELVRALYEEHSLSREKLTTVFNSLLLAFAKTKKANTADKVFELLEQMKEAGVMPDATTHNIVMSSIMKNGVDGPQKAFQYFLKLESQFYSGEESHVVHIDTYTYNIALDALSRSGDRDSTPGQALEVLGRMMKSNSIEPDTATYNIVMKILTKSSLDDAALRAEELLKEMENSGGTLQPSVVSYATCISAWGRTRSPDRYHRMRQLLMRMEASHKNGNQAAKPDAVSFNTVFVACCCRADGREAALRCVLETVDHLRRTPGVRPNQSTYPVLLRAIGLNTSPGERQSYLLSKEFDNCTVDGLVDEEVFKTLQDVSPQVLLAKLSAVHCGNTSPNTYSEIPLEWRRNVTFGANNRSPGY